MGVGTALGFFVGTGVGFRVGKGEGVSVGIEEGIGGTVASTFSLKTFVFARGPRKYSPSTPRIIIEPIIIYLISFMNIVCQHSSIQGVYQALVHSKCYNLAYADVAQWQSGAFVKRKR